MNTQSIWMMSTMNIDISTNRCHILQKNIFYQFSDRMPKNKKTTFNRLIFSGLQSNIL